MNTLQFILLAFMMSFTYVKAENLDFSSPNGKIQVKVSTGKYLYYQVNYKGKKVIDPSPISIQIKNGSHLGKNPIIIAVTERIYQGEITNKIGVRSLISDHYKEVKIECKGDYDLLFRMYDDAIAYRIVLKLKGQYEVLDEQVEYRFPDYYQAWISDNNTPETLYSLQGIYDRSPDKKIVLPCLIDYRKEFKVALLEADVRNYPSLKLDRSSDSEIIWESAFDRYPLKFKQGGFNNYVKEVVEKADYIAALAGYNELPWRAMIISDSDLTFPDNDLVYKLAKPSVLDDVEWIKPGKACWDWWHDYVIQGVDFTTGINTATYMKHIDFAIKYGLEYIIVDWKWTDKYDLSLLNPDVDIQKIITYGRHNNVGTILWVPAYTLLEQLDKTLDQMEKWGAAGIKVDFFDRFDQLSNSMYETIAAAAAKRRIIVDFHGCAMPTGLNRTYPNVLNFEAVHGNENNKWAKTVTVEHKVLLPFIRSMAGPMDFTPGGMRNEHTSSFMSRATLPMVQGTRASEMALFLLYHEPLKMLCDATSEYEKEQDITSFIAAVPVVWDDTKVLAAEVGNYLCIARRKGFEWYIAALNGKDARQLNVALSFLEGNALYNVTVFEDGKNVNKIAKDYNQRYMRVTRDETIQLSLASGGGALLKIIRVK